MFRRPKRGTPPNLSRMLKNDVQMRVRPVGKPQPRASDIYHLMLRASWPALLAYFTATFVGFNLIFAALYRLDPAGIDWGTRPVAAATFWRAFFFSVDTVATVGYGNMIPVSLYANVLGVIEIALGILFIALVTGIMFARFSRPTARILFSKVAVIAPVDGVPTLMFRAANQRHNLIFEASASVSVLTDEVVEGGRMRRFRDLDLVRSSNPVFALTWTIMHPVGPDSPLAWWLEERPSGAGFEIVVVLSGVDDRTGQTIHGRWAYTPKDLRWNARFVDILGEAEDGARTINYGKFDETHGLPTGNVQAPIAAT